MISFRARLLIALLLFASGVGGQLVLAKQLSELQNARAVDLRYPLSEFPERIGLWSSTELPPDPKMIDDIKIDDYLQRVYVHPSGERLVLWMSYSKKSNDQYHYPTVCMQGAGWSEDEASRKRLTAFESPATAAQPVGALTAEDSSDRRSVPVMEMLFTKNQSREFVYYWYYLIGEDAVDRRMREFSKWARAFLRGRRNASLTIEVFSQSKTPDRRLLAEFVGQTATLLDDFMPKGTEAACDLGANY